MESPSGTMAESGIEGVEPKFPENQNVKRQLEKLHQRKAAGPDGITPRILKTCASQLSPVLGHLYNLSLSQEKVPMLWKTSCLVPVPKKFEAIRPGRLQTRRPHISCDEGPGETGLTPAEATGGGTVRITFFDFSSAFNTIQPLLLGEKLRVMGVDDTMISWITDYVTGRPQFVRLGSVLSDVVKFSDDSAVVGCIREGEEGGRRWPSQPLRIRGEVVEEVEDYKYLGVVIDNRLDWKSNTEAVYKKGMSRLYFLRKLRSFKVGSRMLKIFYQSVVASAIFFAAACGPYGRARSGGSAHLLPEPQSGQGPNDMENFLCSPSARDYTLQGAQPLQTCGPNFSPDEDHEETLTQASPPRGEPKTGPPAVRLPGWHRGG
ncbi:hypothetical protein L3Q82_007811 [Scortum barcoo]|uniref:Uncharacterized protein n=1 Tax=Scortum barcoo TaxID=214431 RepID=A0ACB8WK77_9TELE|nr:hypothetical protein L3Q82_007811 [Scortum barcoo]